MKNSYQIIFAGTPEFSVETLAALLNSEHTVKAVYTQPDRPAGRGRKLTPSPVKQLALNHHLPIYQPQTLRDEKEQQVLASIEADIMIVVAYGLLLPAAVLNAPRLGCINVHASLLPRWRGAAPIQRAILAGDEKTGVTIMQMAQGLDTGDMLYKVECPVTIFDTSETVHAKLASLGAKALLETLARLSEMKAEKQNEALTTYAHKISKEEAKIDWTRPALELQRKIRAFNPWPVATATLDEINLRVWQADVISEEKIKKRPGEILHVSAKGIDVATGSGILQLQKIQLPGARVLPVSDILNAHQIHFTLGKVFS